MNKMHKDIELYFLLEHCIRDEKLNVSPEFDRINKINYPILKQKVSILSKEEILFLRMHYCGSITKKRIIEELNITENQYYAKIRKIEKRINNNEFYKIYRNGGNLCQNHEMLLK